jgi:hypothetical protein
VLLTATGCANLEPPVVDPSGVDTLEEPSPSPDPTDFVDAIDHPFLAWTAGSTQTLDSGRTLTIGEPEQTGELTTTPVSMLDPDGEQVTGDFAQDTEGNVWRIEPGSAYLWLPAEPRRGDGWQVGPGEVASVVSTEGTVEGPAGEQQGALVVEIDDERFFYLREEGLVAVVGAGGVEQREG